MKREKSLPGLFSFLEPMKFSVKKASIFFLSTLVVSAGVYYVFLRTEEVFAVKKQDIVKQVSMNGTMIAAENIDLGFPVDGVVAAVTVRVGDHVQRDDVLAELARGRKEAEIKQYEAKIAVEKATLSQLLSGVNRQEVDLFEARVLAATTALENARQELEDRQAQGDNDLSGHYALARDYGETILLNAENAMKALYGIYDEKNAFRGIFIVPESRERSDAEWQMMLARTAFANSEAECAKMKIGGSYAAIDASLSNIKTNLEVIRTTLFKTAEVLGGANVVFGGPDISGFITTMMVQRSVINGTQTAILTVEQNIAAQKITNNAAINQAHKKINEADAALAFAEGEFALKKSASADGAIALHQAQIKEYESSLQIIREDIENGILRAPVDGVVARIAILRGALIKKQTVVVTLTPSGDTQVDAHISREDATQVRVGDAAHIFLGGATVEGRVVSVFDDAIRVHVEKGDTVFTAPQEVTGTIDAVVKRGSLLIPKTFLSDEEGAKSVRIRSSDGVQTVFVLPGIEWNGYVEILEGIMEGDIVIKPR